MTPGRELKKAKEHSALTGAASPILPPPGPTPLGVSGLLQPVASPQSVAPKQLQLGQAVQRASVCTFVPSVDPLTFRSGANEDPGGDESSDDWNDLGAAIPQISLQVKRRSNQAFDSFEERIKVREIFLLSPLPLVCRQLLTPKESTKGSLPNLEQARWWRSVVAATAVWRQKMSGLTLHRRTRTSSARRYARC